MRSVAEVAADLGLPAEQLYRWRRAFAKSGATSFPGNGNINSADEELVRLKRELKQVKEERDFLQKATAELHDLRIFECSDRAQRCRERRGRIGLPVVHGTEQTGQCAPLFTEW